MQVGIADPTFRERKETLQMRNAIDVAKHIVFGRTILYY